MLVLRFHRVIETLFLTISARFFLRTVFLKSDTNANSCDGGGGWEVKSFNMADYFRSFTFSKVQFWFVKRTIAIQFDRIENKTQKKIGVLCFLFSTLEH